MRKLLLVVWLVALAILGAYSMDSDAWIRSHLPFMKSAADSRDTINVAPYIYGQTPPVWIGEIKNSDNAYVHLKLRFRADSSEGNPNVFQTAPVNRGMRMEISGSTAAIIVPDLSVPGDLKGLTLTTALKTGQWYTLEVEALNGAYVHATLDGHLVADYASAGLSMETSVLLVGGGFDASRAFRGQIDNISITKGNIAYQAPEQFSIDNRDTINVLPYIYGKTPLVWLGEIKNPDNAYVHLKFRFRADNTEGNPNVFQTAPVNRGMRMEISGSTAAIIVPDLFVPGGLKGLPLTTTLKTGQWYILEVEELNGAFARAILDGHLVADYASAGLSMGTSQLLVGGGFDTSRTFRGQIENISVTKGNVAHRFPEKSPADNRNTINVAPYIYGKTPLVSLGKIKSPDNAYVHLKFRFRADNTDGNPNIFQTAPVNRGMRMEISGSTMAIIVPDLSVPGGLKRLTLTTTLKTGQWYTLEVVALNGSFVHATLDGHLVADYANAGISMETSQLLVGGGFDMSSVFRGQIDNISIIKSNRLLYKSRGMLHTFYSVFLIGLLIFLVEFFLAKKIFVHHPILYQRGRAYTGLAILSIGTGFIYYVYYLMVNGYLPSPFVYDKSDTFMDLFNVLYWANNDGRYTDWGSVYPPLTFLILRLINFVSAGEGHGTAAVMRDNSPLVAGFFLIYLAIPAIMLKTKLWQGLPANEKILLYFAIILSTPMLFALERGNLIVLCPVLLALVLSRVGFVRCLCIALLINIKPYFALLMIYYLARKNRKGFATSAVLSGLIFVVSGFALDNHFLVFFKNLLGFSQSKGMFSFKDVMALPSSISAFSYALKNPEGASIVSGFLSTGLITIITYIIEAVKWIVIAISLAILFIRSKVMRDSEIFALLVVAITNLGVWVGGYSLIYYIVLIPVFIKLRETWLYIGLLSVLAMPLDILPIITKFIGQQYSYISNSYVDVQWYLGPGSVIRPIANFVLLLMLSREFITRKQNISVNAVHLKVALSFFKKVKLGS